MDYKLFLGYGILNTIHMYHASLHADIKLLITSLAFLGSLKSAEVIGFLAQMRISPSRFPTQMELHM